MVLCSSQLNAPPPRSPGTQREAIGSYRVLCGGSPCWLHDAILKVQSWICYNVGFSIVDLDMIESSQISVAGFFLCSWFVVTLQSRLEYSTGSASRFVSHEPAASLSVTYLPTDASSLGCLWAE